MLTNINCDVAKKQQKTEKKEKKDNNSEKRKCERAESTHVRCFP